MKNSELKQGNEAPSAHFPAAHFIKEIGRGVKGARSLSFNGARELFEAIVAGRVSDLELGAIMIAMRIKGESIEEIGGFLQAAESSIVRLQAPDSPFMPVVIPSYNGARRAANLTPLLALLLAREGVPVLVHGVTQDAGRVTTAEIFQEMGIAPCVSIQLAEQQWQSRLPAFMAIDHLAPRLAQLLALRKILGLRNSTHTLVKIIQPFAQPALRLTSYTHPEYASMLTQFFASVADPTRGDVLLMRATEGETVANTKKVQQIDWFHAKQRRILVEAQVGSDIVLPIPADAQGTAAWIQEVMAGQESIPENIARQVQHCLDIAKHKQGAMQ